MDTLLQWKTVCFSTVLLPVWQRRWGWDGIWGLVQRLWSRCAEAYAKISPLQHTCEKIVLMRSHSKAYWNQIYYLVWLGILHDTWQLSLGLSFLPLSSSFWCRTCSCYLFGFPHVFSFSRHQATRVLATNLGQWTPALLHVVYVSGFPSFESICRTIPTLRSSKRLFCISTVLDFLPRLLSLIRARICTA